MTKISLGKLKAPAKKKTAKKEYPTISNETVTEIVDELRKQDKLAKAATGSLEAAKAALREEVLETGIFNIQRGKPSMVCEGTDGEVMITFTNGFRSDANEETIGASYWDRFQEKMTVGIDVDALGDRAQDFIDKLSELADSMGVLDAVSIKSINKPKSLEAYVNGLTVDEAVLLDSKYKIPTMIKVR